MTFSTLRHGWIGLLFLVGGCVCGAAPEPAPTLLPATAAIAAEPPVHALKVTVLSTMLVGSGLFKGLGEWGFSALVEVDGKCLLFDTGLRPITVLNNAHELGIDLSDVTEVVLSHNHIDHTGGLLELRKAYSAQNPAALSHVHVGRGIFWKRGPEPVAAEDIPMAKIKAAFEATGGTFTEYDRPVQLAPGVWLTGPIPRPFDEKNWGGGDLVESPAGWISDNIPEETALVFDTREGLVVLTGCGHAGIVNTLTYARQIVRPGASIHAALGGFHLLRDSDAQLAWTAGKLREFKLANLLGAHCTGLEANYQLRERLGLTRQTAVVGAVGSSFELGKGIDPLPLAK